MSGIVSGLDWALNLANGGSDARSSNIGNNPNFPSANTQDPRLFGGDYNSAYPQRPDVSRALNSDMYNFGSDIHSRELAKQYYPNVDEGKQSTAFQAQQFMGPDQFASASYGSYWDPNKSPEENMAYFNQQRPKWFDNAPIGYHSYVNYSLPPHFFDKRMQNQQGNGGGWLNRLENKIGGNNDLDTKISPYYSPGTDSMESLSQSNPTDINPSPELAARIEASGGKPVLGMNTLTQLQLAKDRQLSNANGIGLTGDPNADRGINGSNSDYNQMIMRLAPKGLHDVAAQQYGTRPQSNRPPVGTPLYDFAGEGNPEPRFPANYTYNDNLRKIPLPGQRPGRPGEMTTYPGVVNTFNEPGNPMSGPPNIIPTDKQGNPLNPYQQQDQTAGVIVPPSNNAIAPTQLQGQIQLNQNPLKQQSSRIPLLESIQQNSLQSQQSPLTLNPQIQDLQNQLGPNQLHPLVQTGLSGQKQTQDLRSVSLPQQTAVQQMTQKLRQSFDVGTKSDGSVNTMANLPTYLKDPLAKASAVSGIDPKTLAGMSYIESGWKPSARAGNGQSASGLFQFTNGTWNAMVNKYGKQYGIGIADKNNPEKQSIMAGLMARDNAQAIKKEVHINPTSTDIYMTHFLGTGGGTRFLKGMERDPEAPAVNYVDSKQVAANKGIFYKHGEALPAYLVYNNFKSKMQEGFNKLSQSGGAGQPGPQQAIAGNIVGEKPQQSAPVEKIPTQVAANWDGIVKDVGKQADIGSDDGNDPESVYRAAATYSQNPKVMNHIENFGVPKNTFAKLQDDIKNPAQAVNLLHTVITKPNTPFTKFIPENKIPWYAKSYFYSNGRPLNIKQVYHNIVNHYDPDYKIDPETGI